MRTKMDSEEARVQRLSFDELSLEIREGRRRLDELESAESQHLVDAPSSANREWKDVSVDAWGARRKGLGRQWSNGQCLQACVASLLGCDVKKVPDPTASYNAKPDWHDHYNERLAKATGFRLEHLPPSLCPPRKATQLWIAGIHEPGDRDGHAVVAIGGLCHHDPAGIYQGSLRMDRVTAGMLVVPTKRVVPVLRSHGQSRRMVVPA